MSQHQWSIIRAIFKSWEERIGRDTAGNWRAWVDLFFKSFDEMEQLATSRCQKEGLQDAESIPIALAMMGLGPEQQEEEDYPADTWCQLVELAKVHDSAKPVNLPRDLVIAWGCGWGRSIEREGGGWAQRWQRAVFALHAFMEGSINTTLWRLQNTIEYASEGIMELIQNKREIAGLLSMEFIHGRCSCGKHKKTCKKHGEEQQCGRACCREDHQLSFWEPDKISLQAYTAQAVRGNASATLLSGALSNGMIAGILAEDMGLLISNAEFKVCAECQHESVSKARQEGIEPRGKELVLYEGNSCPVCDTKASHTTTYYKFRKNWILIPYDMGGSYELLERWRCRPCRNLYPVTFTHCPWCSESHPQRKTYVWVYRSRKQH